MKTLGIIGAVAALGLATPALAGLEYATYEGRDAIQEGQGGTKVTKNGIDYWTTGAPPRRYQVLGMVTDTRGDGPISGKVIGSKALAKKVTAAGGDAVVMMDQNSKVAGVARFGNVYGTEGGFRTDGVSRVKNTITSTLLVVKYLD